LRILSLRRSVISATFGLTSLGKYGPEAIIAPTVSTCIFGVGAVEDRAIPIGNEVEIRKMFTLSLCVDTEVMTFYSAARMMTDIKNILEGGLTDILAEQTDVRRMDGILNGADNAQG
jgi:pyruvate/2-oxoglutarate dehydrogenase complex dihydrolipoamide acyltransferase (E2) component